MLAVAALALLLMRPSAAHAEVTDLTPPPDGCLAYDVGAVAMADTTDVQTLTLDAEGPVVQVIIEWAGIWQPAPLDPTIGVEVAGPGGTASGSYAGTESTDATGLPDTPPSTTYGYVADITDLFTGGDAGTYTVNITPPIDGVDGGENRWGGATVTLVYDSSPCEDVATVIWKTGADFYFGGNSTSSPTTELIVYDWGYPLAEDYTASFSTSHAGADYDATSCRVSSIWVATGTGAAPASTDDLVDDDGVANPAYGGVEGLVAPFSPPGQGCPATVPNAPVVSFSGENVGPEQALIQFDVLIPAGSTWTAFQLESPADNGGHPGLPESGAWSGAGLLILPAFVPPVPDIALEKTVLAGADATCPGVEGTDELVTGEVDAPVTYCFKVTNTGEVPLNPVELDDPDLGITHADMTLVTGDDTVALEPGGELVYSYSSTITAELVNTATVTGYPTDQGDPVTDTNDAAVEPLPMTPDIALEKTVLEGADATCPGVEGTDERVSGEAGTPVTYCFKVTNTGEVPLNPVELDDPDLGITHEDMTLVSGDDAVPLAPGGELVYSYGTRITGDLMNTATVTGQPPSGEPVTDTNDAAVEMYVITGTVTPFCEADAPYLGYDIQTTAPGATAIITFTGDGGSESVTVDVGTGQVLWPGAAVGPDGVGIDWPGWDQDAEGTWFENPDGAYAWARPEVEITVTVNPTTEPVTVVYPPGTPTCSTAPPPNETPAEEPPPSEPPADQPPAPGAPPASSPPPLAQTGAGDPSGPVGLAAALALLGATLVLFSRSLVRRARR
ncbi:MAG TPA: hypothetical protein H9815_11845 [Candidatus Ruania gallistercoris]|uniref:DUF7507 domain-containing protein n=1 Tax=Candidatus Ruania gallistercoris TaxID=2838746 RepID=A0A9D2EES5_9MICO|nr:hypothetical protein [Candidatus Ruania gallistercoris]